MLRAKPPKPSSPKPQKRQPTPGPGGWKCGGHRLRDRAPSPAGAGWQTLHPHGFVCLFCLARRSVLSGLYKGSPGGLGDLGV